MLSIPHTLSKNCAIILFSLWCLLTLQSVQADVNPIPVTTVSAASYENGGVTPDSIVSAFGTKLATATANATDIDTSTPAIDLPTNLSGTTVQVDGQFAGILFVSPLQVNFIIPSGTKQGEVTIKITSGDGTESNGTVSIGRVKPAIFTLNSNGQGVPAAEVVRIKADGTQIRESLAARNPMTNQFITKPINFGADTDRIFLEIYLTGIRGIIDNNSDGNLNENVWVIIGGQALTPSYAGPQPYFAGLDQVNVELPRSLIGKGKLKLVIHARRGASPSFSDPGFSSEQVELEVGNANPGPLPTITSLSTTSAKAGDTVFVTGTGFAPNPADNVVTIGGVKANVESVVDSNHLVISVPYGAVSGRIKVVTAQGESTNLIGLTIRTSVSGYVVTADSGGLDPTPLRNITVRSVGTNISTVTNTEGVFTLLDVPVGDATLEIDPTAFPLAGTFTKVTLPINVVSARDNFLPQSIWLTSTGMVTETDGVGITTVAGVVYDLDGITPVPNARIRAYAYGYTFQAATQTDDGGAFILRGVPSIPSLRILAEVARLDGKIFRIVKLATTRREAMGYFSFPVIADVNLKNAPANRNPLLIVPLSSMTMDITETKDVPIFAEDPDLGDSLQVGVNGPANISILPGTNGAFTIRLKPTSGGVFTVTVTATDGANHQVTKSFGLTVTAPNTAPVVTVPGAKAISVGQLVSFDVTATDPDAGQTITLVASNLPRDAKFTQTSTNPLTGTFSWTPDSNQRGTYVVKFTAQDNGTGALTDTKTVIITVSGPLPAGVWTRISSSLPNIINSVTVDGDDIYAGVYANGVYVTSDYGVTWKKLGTGWPALPVDAIIVNGNTIYASVNVAGVYRSLDKGETWTLVYPSPVGLLTKQADRVIVVGKRAEISVDQGATWKILIERNESYLNPIVVSDGRGTVFVQGNDGQIFLLEGSGSTINLKPVILYPTNMPYSVATINSKVFISSKQLNPDINYYFMSSDGGISWVDVTSRFPANSAGTLRGIRDKLYAYTNKGNLVSNDEGLTWNALSSPLPFTANDKYLISAGSGILVMPLP